MDYKKYFENDIKSIPFSDVIDQEALYLEYRETEVFPDINIFLSKAFENIGENSINDEIVLQKEAEFLALMKDKSKDGKLKLLEYSKPSIATTKTFKALERIQDIYDFILDSIAHDEDYEKDKLTLIFLIRSILSPYNQQAVLKSIVEDDTIETRSKLGEFVSNDIKQKLKIKDFNLVKRDYENFKSSISVFISDNQDRDIISFGEENFETQYETILLSSNEKFTGLVPFENALQFSEALLIEFEKYHDQFSYLTFLRDYRNLYKLRQENWFSTNDKVGQLLVSFFTIGTDLDQGMLLLIANEKDSDIKSYLLEIYELFRSSSKFNIEALNQDPEIKSLLIKEMGSLASRFDINFKEIDRFLSEEISKEEQRTIETMAILKYGISIKDSFEIKHVESKSENDDNYLLYALENNKKALFIFERWVELYKNNIRTHSADFSFLFYKLTRDPKTKLLNNKSNKDFKTICINNLPELNLEKIRIDGNLRKTIGREEKKRQEDFDKIVSDWEDQNKED